MSAYPLGDVELCHCMVPTGFVKTIGLGVPLIQIVWVTGLIVPALDVWLTSTKIALLYPGAQAPLVTIAL